MYQNTGFSEMRYTDGILYDLWYIVLYWMSTFRHLTDIVNPRMAVDIIPFPVIVCVHLHTVLRGVPVGPWRFLIVPVGVIRGSTISPVVTPWQIMFEMIAFISVVSYLNVVKRDHLIPNSTGRERRGITKRIRREAEEAVRDIHKRREARRSMQSLI